MTRFKSGSTKISGVAVVQFIMAGWNDAFCYQIDAGRRGGRGESSIVYRRAFGRRSEQEASRSGRDSDEISKHTWNILYEVHLVHTKVHTKSAPSYKIANHLARIL